MIFPACGKYLHQGFFSLQAQKLKAKKTQTQGNFPKNSRKFLQKLINPEIFKNFFCHFHLMLQKFPSHLHQRVIKPKQSVETQDFFPQKLKKFQETQGNFPKTQATFLKNSIYRKLHSPKLPPKRRKKTPAV